MDSGAWQATIHGVTESHTTEQLTLLLHFQHNSGINFDADSVLIYYTYL